MTTPPSNAETSLVPSPWNSGAITSATTDIT